MKILYYLVFISLGIISLSCNADSYVYIDNFAGDTKRIDANKKILIAGDVADKIKICGQSSEYQCFYNDLISFVVPRKLMKGQNEWDFNSQTFTIYQKSDLRLLGEEYPVVHIQSKDRDIINQFIYSYKHGLIGWGGYSKKENRIIF